MVNLDQYKMSNSNVINDLQNNRSNYTYLGHGFYIVRTQAGFVKAMTHFLGEKNKELDVKNFPRVYPSVITFHIDYDGDLHINSNIIPFNKLLKGLQENNNIINKIYNILSK